MLGSVYMELALRLKLIKKGDRERGIEKEKSVINIKQLQHSFDIIFD